MYLKVREYEREKARKEERGLTSIHLLLPYVIDEQQI